MPSKKRKGEYLDSQTKDRAVYHYIDDSLKIDVKSKEVYPKLKRVIHFPFNSRTGKQRYPKVESITYENLLDPLPRGILKDSNRGYGFTKVLSPIIYALEAVFGITKVIVKPKGKIYVKGATANLSYADLNKFYPKMVSLLAAQGEQRDILTNNFLKQYFAKKFKGTKQKYIKGSIYSLISSQVADPKSLSKEDYESMLGLVVKGIGEQSVESKKVVITTKEKIEKRFLEDAIAEFKKILSQKSFTGKLEKKWETLFKENSWIISNLFSLPVLLFANQAYVGGKEIFNTNGKVTDFLFKNSLTDNLAIIELKTHKTPLLDKKPYRGSDVYSLSAELSGSVNQVLDQRQNLLNEFHALRSKSGQKDWFESFNSKCLIIAGNIKDLPLNGKRSFEIFRNNLYGVEIITFDEVLQKIEAFANLIKK